MEKCLSCPRYCLADRKNGKLGYCKTGDEYIIGGYNLHFYEEPPISGEKGSGTIFFSGCNLSCIFCQNRKISHTNIGKIFSEDELIDAMLLLQEKGANNINLVTPTHFALKLAKTLEKAKPKLNIPIVYNSSCYESIEALKSLDGLVDIYLPDFKYFDNSLAVKYSNAPNYREIATTALSEMIRQVPKAEFSEELMKKGIIVRHLILPGNRIDSINVVKYLFDTFGNRAFYLSLMRQYTPDFALDTEYKELHRRLTTFEYEKVLDVANELDFEGFSQEKPSADKYYTPDFLK